MQDNTKVGEFVFVLPEPVVGYLKPEQNPPKRTGLMYLPPGIQGCGDTITQRTPVLLLHYKKYHNRIKS